MGKGLKLTEKVLLDEEILKSEMRREKLSDEELSRALGTSPEALDDWIRNGFPTTSLIQLKRVLKLTRETYRALLKISGGYQVLL